MKIKDVIARADAVIARVKKNMDGGAPPAQGTAAPTTREVTPEQFIAHAEAEMAQAAKDPPTIAKRRLATLLQAVEVMKTETWESSGAGVAKIPVFTESTTAASDQTEKTLGNAGPVSPASTQYSSNNPNEYMAKAAERLAALKGEMEIEVDDEEDDEDDEEEDPEADAEDKAKKDKAKKEKTSKALGADGWPDDLNETPVQPSWGKDDF